jgi:hypothetical protein
MERGALNQKEAAAWLGVSVNHFKQHVRPYVAASYIGGARRWTITELQRYLDSVTHSTKAP